MHFTRKYKGIIWIYDLSENSFFKQSKQKETDFQPTQNFVSFLHL